MDYNNLTKRSITGLFLIIVFFLFINFLEIYIPYVLILIYIVILCEILFFFKNKKQRSFVLFLYVFLSLTSIEIYFIYFMKKIYFYILFF